MGQGDRWGRGLGHGRLESQLEDLSRCLKGQQEAEEGLRRGCVCSEVRFG